MRYYLFAQQFDGFIITRGVFKEGGGQPKEKPPNEKVAPWKEQRLNGIMINLHVINHRKGTWRVSRFLGPFFFYFIHFLPLLFSFGNVIQTTTRGNAIKIHRDCRDLIYPPPCVM